MILKLNTKKISLMLLGMWCAFSYIQVMYLYDCVSWYRPIFWGSRIVLIIFVWIFYFIKKHYKELDLLLVIGLGIFSFIFLVNTIYNGGKILSCAIFLLSLISIIAFFDLLDGNDLQYCIRGMMLFLWVLLFVQIISIYLKPEGLYNYQIGRKYYFLGHVNYSGKVLVWGVAFQAFLEKHKKKSLIKTFIYWLLSLIVVGVSRSYISIVGIALLGVLLFCGRRIKISSKWIIFGNVIIILLLKIIHFFINNLQHLEMALSKIGRMLSLTIRFSIFEQGLRMALKRVNGYGYIDDYSKYIWYGNYFPSSAHNLNIDILISVGVFGLLAFYVYIFALVKNSENNIIAYPILCTALVSVFMWNFEPYLSPAVFLLTNSGFVILYNVKNKIDPHTNCSIN